MKELTLPLALTIMNVTLIFTLENFMPLSSRFTIALHMLTVMDVFKDEKITSQFMAGSIGVNPVIIRRLLSQLRTADIVTVKRGSGGASI